MKLTADAQLAALKRYLLRERRAWKARVRTSQDQWESGRYWALHDALKQMKKLAAAQTPKRKQETP